MSRLSWCLAAALLTSGVAVAQDSAFDATSSDTAASTTETVSGGGQGWSVVSAQTVGTGNNFINVQAGYPGLFGSIIHGQSEGLDIGGKFGFIYGQEAGTFYAGTVGLRLQGIVRFLLQSDAKMKMGLEIEPGIYTQFPAFGGVFFGIIAPVKFTVAFPITSALTVHAGADLPLLINITNGFVFAIPILLGGGVEYFINDSLSLNLRVRLGPSINIVSGGTLVTFGLDTLAGVAFRI